jgi:hypothetical protein
MTPTRKAKLDSTEKEKYQIPEAREAYVFELDKVIAYK